MSTARPYEVIADGADEAGWLEARRTLVTASDVSAVMGLSPYRSALEVWMRKTGRDEENASEESEAAGWGRKLEPMILDEFARRSGVKVTPNKALIRSRMYPWLGCTVDGWTEDGDPFEAKTAGYYAARDWADGVPAYYTPQLQTANIVARRVVAWMGALLAGQRFVWGSVEYDEAQAQAILSTTEAFHRHLVDDTPPAPDGSESAARALFRLYPREKKDAAAVVLDHEAIEAAELFDEWKARAAEATTNVEVWSQRLKAAIGEAERGILPAGGGFTYRAQTRKPVCCKACGVEVQKGAKFRVLRRVAAE